MNHILSHFPEGLPEFVDMYFQMKANESRHPQKGSIGLLKSEITGYSYRRDHEPSH